MKIKFPDKAELRKAAIPANPGSPGVPAVPDRIIQRMTWTPASH